MHTGCQHSFGSEDDKRLVPTGFRHSLWSQDDEWLVPPAVGTRSGGFPCREGKAPPLSCRASKDYKWLLHSSCQHLFGSEDDKRLVPTGLSAFVLGGELRADGAPICWHSFGRGGSNDHKWLVHTDRQHSFGSDDDKRLVPTGYRLSFWSKD